MNRRIPPLYRAGFGALLGVFSLARLASAESRVSKAPAVERPADGLPNNLPTTALRVPTMDRWIPKPAASISAGLQELVFNFANLFLAIPDHSAVGVVHEPTVSTLAYPIQSLAVDLKISSREAGAPMFNGDLFVTLRHESGYSVLLNRVGRRAESSLGYADNGFNITLDDGAAADVHTYRTTVMGSDVLPISSSDPASPLTGIWKPDARAVDPNVVLSTTSRTATLSSFNGQLPSGQWTLFVADLSPEGLAQLDSWTLRVTVIPETESIATCVAGALTAVAIGRRVRRRRLSSGA